MWRVSVLTALAAAPLSLWTPPAQADWQYTKWGMTPAEVIRASNGKATANADQGKNTDIGKVKLAASYQAKDIVLKAYFQLDEDDKLSLVLLDVIEPSNCYKVESLLSQFYGKDEYDSEVLNISIKRWRDVNNGNIVSYWYVGGKCDIKYYKIDEPGKLGGL
jgi:hypothetical protein